MINNHPAVDDCIVQGHSIDGIGHLPRAYIVTKSGYEATADEILSFVHARVTDTDKLRGGVVFVDKLKRDSSGNLLINLEKFDKDAKGMDEQFIKEQPKVKVRSNTHKSTNLSSIAANSLTFGSILNRHHQM